MGKNMSYGWLVKKYDDLKKYIYIRAKGGKTGSFHCTNLTGERGGVGEQYTFFG